MLSTAIGATAVTTTVPALRTDSNACPTCSPLSTPTVTMVESAPCPLVTDRANSAASAIEPNVCVAPSFAAASRFIVTGSTAITWPAPACAAPWTALIPIPPTPMTITTCPGCTWAAFTAEPQPVGTPQPSSAAERSETCDGMRMQDHSGMTLYSANVPISEDRATSRPW
jgi:hypothetical protein